MFKQAVSGSNANLIYIDENYDTHTVDPNEAEILFATLLSQERKRRPSKAKKNFFGSVTTEKDIFGEEVEEENIFLDNVHLGENAIQKRISMYSDSYIRPRIAPPQDEEISLYLEIYDFKNHKTLFKTPIIDYQHKDQTKYAR